jgi:Protein of unknown function (DUF3224)
MMATPHKATRCPVKAQAKGRFEIKREMLPNRSLGGGIEIMHVRFEKRFEGPLQGDSVVEMLGYMTGIEGSGAYVALERLEGALDERSGSFVLRHAGVMDRGAQALLLEVVPDSATAGLAGLRGEMRIDIVDGKHFYTFDYALPD